MSSSFTWDELKELFEKALDMSDEERSTLFQDVARKNLPLANEVQNLLRADSSGEHFLSKPVFDACQLPSDELKSAIPQSIGPYTILERLDAGGMGTVYKALAKDSSDLDKRNVAVKVMRQGIQSESSWRRFEYEAIILGHLSHHGIARVLDSGRHLEDGFEIPFFAMEFIEDAKDIVSYCRDNQVSAIERARLMAIVCEAIHHGHQKGIIHRDLKPGNILIGRSGDPKVIDYGVACITEDAAMTTLHTQTGQFLGTVGYMSPEQSFLDPGRVDVRSDVYALGTILYELFCGRAPHDLRGLTLMASLEVIRSKDPPPPRDVVEGISKDIETVILKASDRKPDRRYSSAASLARDLNLWREGSPVIARSRRRANAILQLGTRHRGTAIIVGALLMTFVLTSVLGLHLLGKVTHERNEAKRIGFAAGTSLEQTRLSLEELHTQRIQAQDNWNRLQGLFGEVGPPLSPEDTARMLIHVAERAREVFHDEPLKRAELTVTLADRLRESGELDIAANLLDEAFQAFSASSDVSMATRSRAHVAMARVYRDRKDLGAAQGSLQEAILLLRPQAAGRDHRLLHGALRELADIKIELENFGYAIELLMEALIVQISTNENEDTDSEASETIRLLVDLWNRQVSDGGIEETRYDLSSATRRLLEAATTDRARLRAAKFVEELCRLNLTRGRIHTISSLLQLIRELYFPRYTNDDFEVVALLELISDYSIMRDEIEVAQRTAEWARHLRLIYQPDDHEALVQADIRIAQLANAAARFDEGAYVGWKLLHEAPESTSSQTYGALFGILGDSALGLDQIDEARYFANLALCCLIEAWGYSSFQLAPAYERLGHIEKEAGAWDLAELHFATAASCRLALGESGDFRYAIAPSNLAEMSLRRGHYQNAKEQLGVANHWLVSSRLPARHHLSLRLSALKTFAAVGLGRIEEAIRLSHQTVSNLTERDSGDPLPIAKLLLRAAQTSLSHPSARPSAVALLDDLWSLTLGDPERLDWRFRAAVADAWSEWYAQEGLSTQADDWKSRASQLRVGAQLSPMESR